MKDKPSLDTNITTDFIDITFGEVAKILQWYRGRPNTMKDIDKASLERMLAARRKLSVLHVEVGEIDAYFTEEYERAIIERKDYMADRVVFHKQTNTATESEAKARRDAKAMYQWEVKMRGASKKARNKFDAVDKILNSMAGDIRHLESEYKRINYTQTT